MEASAVIPPAQAAGSSVCVNVRSAMHEKSCSGTQARQGPSAPVQGVQLSAAAYAYGAAPPDKGESRHRSNRQGRTTACMAPTPSFFRTACKGSGMHVAPRYHENTSSHIAPSPVKRGQSCKISTQLSRRKVPATMNILQQSRNSRATVAQQSRNSRASRLSRNCRATVAQQSRNRATVAQTSPMLHVKETLP